MQQPLFPENLLPNLDKVLDVAVPFIGKEEGLRLQPYLDSVNVPTIGYGTITYPDGTRVTMQDPPITQEYADKLLRGHITEKVLHQVVELCPGLNYNQYAALVSFAYNLGVGALQGSTLRKMVLAGDLAGAAEEFLKWNKAGGKVLNGLTKRRQREKDLFLTPVS